MHVCVNVYRKGLMPKKRSHGDGALYELKSRGLWRGVVDVGFKADGSRAQKYVHARTQSEARAKLKMLIAEIEQHGAPLDKTKTVEAWATYWLENDCRLHMKPSALKSYRSAVKVWIIPHLGKKKLHALRPSDLRAVTKAVSDAGRSPDTAVKVHTVISSMLESARLDGLVPRNIARDLVAPKAPESQRGALTTLDAYTLLDAAQATPDGTRWWFALLTGMRQGERSGATVDSIDLDAGTFTVKWSLTEAKFEHGCDGECGMVRGGSCPTRRLVMAPGLVYRQLAGRLCLVMPKSGKARTFPLPPILVDRMRQYFASTAHVPNPHGLIWRNEDGSPITANQDNDAWRDLLRRAGLIDDEQAKRPKDRAIGTADVPTTHWARHTTSTILRELGTPAVVVGAIVGHGTERMTDRYTHVAPVSAEAVEAMAAIGARFAGALTER